MANVWAENRQENLTINTDAITWFGQRILCEADNSTASVSILITDNTGIQDFNRSYLNRDRPTSVISFPMQEGELIRGDKTFLGDIVVSAEMASSVAGETGYTSEEILLFYLIHGILHLCGYNHENAPAEGIAFMEKNKWKFSTK